MLEKAVATALYAAAVLERALHEPEGWELALGDVHVPAVRTVEHNGIVFRSVIPDMPADAEMLVLLHRGELKAVRPVESFDRGPQDVVFELRLGDPVGV